MVFEVKLKKNEITVGVKGYKVKVEKILERRGNFRSNKFFYERFCTKSG